ncbi:MAG: hypothetical protein PWQ76_605 [Clostridiales bacterium]|jgi:AraC-like DNA-binding protein/mannose-6-phosphate isomerase-like protein (cupin superfamily)|nr:helix-turn-helix protein [Oscillospiraceae bacterium]MDN5378350.1 hypothetical protein [Clostridiales bacterium]
MPVKIYGYVTTKQVQDVLNNRFEKFQKSTSFIEAMRHLYLINAHALKKPKLAFNCSWDSLSDEDFCKALLEQPVEITDHTLNPDKARVEENMIIPENRDVFCIKHLSHINNNLHSHDFFEVNYVFSGECIQKFEKEDRILKEGEFCIIAPNSPHDIIAEEESLVVSIMIRQSTFEHTFFAVLTQKNLLSTFFRNILYSKTGKGNYLLFHTDNQTEIKKNIKNICMESYSSDEYANTCCASYINILFALILRRYSDTVYFYSFNSTGEEKIDFVLVLQYIQYNYQTLTLSSLAKFFHYSEAYMSKLIKNNTGMNLTEILTSLKMENSKKLLSSTNMSIFQIAECNGYESPDHFSRTFKKTYGISPRQYRKICMN